MDDAATEREFAMRIVGDLAAIPQRGSATVGERAAADFIAGELESIGLTARLEVESAHGTYWWPFGIPNAVAALAGVLALRWRSGRSRAAAAIVGGLTSWLIAEDIEGRRRLLRSRLPQRRTTNVIAEIGSSTASRCLVFHAHHDAARSGLMFHPSVSRVNGPIPVLAEIAAGPLLVAAGAVRGSRLAIAAGTALASLLAVLCADVSGRNVVPGANDDASGVAALLLLARRLAADPPPDLRVLVLSTGAEESLLEGMSGFARTHFSKLPVESTVFISIDSLGWRMLGLRSGENALRKHPADPRLVSRLRELAESLEIRLQSGLRFTIPTDGYIPARAGYPTVNVCSAEPDGTYPRYHSHEDSSQHVHAETILAGANLCEALARDGATY